MENKEISKALLKRLPLYLQYIKALPENTENVSATKMAKALGMGDVLVRKDLAKISGDDGMRKLGRAKESLIRDISAFLEVNRTTCAVLVGSGKLGRALMDYEGFDNAGLHILAGFDSNPVAPETDGGKPIYSVNRLESFCKSHEVAIGIIAVPADNAQEVCNKLVACDIKGIWNFSPKHLTVPDGVIVQSEHLESSLSALRIQMKNN